MLIPRILVTITAAAVPFLMSRVVMPFADPDAVGIYGLAPLSIAALGVSPVLTGFVFVEIAAILIPRLGPLRSSPSGRARLRRAARLLTAALAFLQAAMVARGLLSLGAFGAWSFSTFVLLTLTLTACTAALIVAAEIVDRRGVGNGIVVLVGPTFVFQTAQGLAAIPSSSVNAPASVFVTAALFLGVAFLLTRGPRALSRSERSGAWLRQPVAGIIATNIAAGVLMFFAVMTTFDPGLAPLQGKLAPGTTTYAVAGGVLSAVTAAILTRLFATPRTVASLWSRALGGEPGDHLRAATDAVRVSAFVSAIVGAIPFLVLAHPLTASVSAILAALSIALLLDLGSELRARVTHGELVAIWPLARPYEVEPVLAVLSREGIPALAQNSAWAALLPLSGYAPVVIRVREADAARATDLIRPIVTHV